MLSIINARLHIFCTFLKIASATPGGLQDTHRHQWLRLQVSPAILQSEQDIFSAWVDRLVPTRSSVQSLIDEIHRIFRQRYGAWSSFFIVMDETQRLLHNKYHDFFRATMSNESRPILRPYLSVLKSFFKSVLLSGTGLSMTKTQAVIDSVVSKEGDMAPTSTITRTGFFDTRDGQVEYLSRYIPEHILNSASGKALQSRIDYWLHGR